jgi:hypothetical protein
MRRTLPLGALVAALLAVPVAGAVVSVSVSDGTVIGDGSRDDLLQPGFDGPRSPPGQDEQAISGMAGIAGVRCTGKARTYLVTVTPFQGAFHVGETNASPFVLVQRRGAEQTESGRSAATILLA